jgi:hypothetical protein
VPAMPPAHLSHLTETWNLRNRAFAWGTIKRV